MRYALIEMNEAQAIFIGLTTAFPEDTQVTFVLCVKSSARLLHSIPRHQMRPELCFTRDHAMSHCARDRTLIAFLCLRHRAFQLVSDVIAKMHLSGSDSNNSPCCPIYFKFTAKVEYTVSPTAIQKELAHLMFVGRSRCGKGLYQVAIHGVKKI